MIGYLTSQHVRRAILEAIVTIGVFWGLLTLWRSFDEQNSLGLDLFAQVGRSEVPFFAVFYVCFALVMGYIRYRRDPKGDLQ